MQRPETGHLTRTTETGAIITKMASAFKSRPLVFLLPAPASGCGSRGLS